MRVGIRASLATTSKPEAFENPSRASRRRGGSLAASFRSDSDRLAAFGRRNLNFNGDGVALLS